MSVVIETTLGDITVDLFIYERPRACLNFLKLCKFKYYNFNLFHTISRGFIAQTGDPTGTRTGGESVFAIIDGASKRYFEAETEPRIKHTRPGLISFVGNENLIASQFFLTLGENLTYLDEKHCVFGEVVEGFEILESINEVICDNDDRPFQDVRITHTVVLDDPYPDPQGLRIPSRSPSPSAERLAGGRIAPDEDIDEISGKSAKEVAEMQAEREAKARATILEMVGDIPDAEMAPPENVLFVCKLNPVTNDDDLEIIFSRFGKIKSCEVIRDRKSGDSLQYAFIEFEEQKACEDAYFKMDNVLVDDRRIHVDFSQSVSRVKWLGKGRGVAHFDEKGNKKKTDFSNDIGKGNYNIKNESTRSKNLNNTKHGRQSRSPRRNRERSTSLENPNDSLKKKSRSPRKHQRRRSLQRESISPKRMKERSRSPIKKSRSPRRSPVERKDDNGSPKRYTPKRNNRNSPTNRSFSPKSRKNMNRYSPERRRRYSRSPKVTSKKRSRSPRRQSRSPSYRSRYHSKRSSSEEDNFNYKGKKSKENQTRTTRSSSSPSKKNERRDNLVKLQRESNTQNYKRSKSKSPSRKATSLESNQRRRNEPPLSVKHSKKHGDSKKEEQKKVRKSTSAEDKIDKSSKYRKNVSPERSIVQSETKPSNSKTSLLKNKKAKRKSSKKKKTKKYYSSGESDSDSEDKKKTKKKKYKKRAESSTDSSSSTTSSTSSEEESSKKLTKKQKLKKQIKKKKTKQSKKRKSSSSDSSDSETSDSTSSSSESESKTKIKKKMTKNKSESH